MTTEYTIVDAPSTNELIEQVASMIDIGFEPVGGVVVETSVFDDAHGTTYSHAYLQAMVKRAPRGGEK